MTAHKEHAAKVIADVEITEEAAQSTEAFEETIAEASRQHIKSYPVDEQIAVIEGYDWENDAKNDIASSVEAVRAWGAGDPGVSDTPLRTGIVDAASHAIRRTGAKMVVLEKPA